MEKVLKLIVILFTDFNKFEGNFWVIYFMLGFRSFSIVLFEYMVIAGFFLFFLEGRRKFFIMLIIS